MQKCGCYTEYLSEQQLRAELEYIICGGASIFRQSYPYAKKAYVSFVKEAYEVDTWFDNFDLADWDIVCEEDHPDFIYRELVRKETK